MSLTSNVAQGTKNYFLDLVALLQNDARTELPKAEAYVDEHVATALGNIEDTLTNYGLEFVPGLLRPEVAGFVHGLVNGAKPPINERLELGLDTMFMRLDAMLGGAGTNSAIEDTGTLLQRSSAEVNRDQLNRDFPSAGARPVGTATAPQPGGATAQAPGNARDSTRPSAAGQ